jgi:hypothetical protein
MNQEEYLELNLDEAAKVNKTLSTKGWGILKSRLEEKIDDLTFKLLNASEYVYMLKYQSQINAIKELFQIIDNYSELSETSEKELKMIRR